MDIFLDTTYLMPFFNIDIDVDGFSRELFRKKLSNFNSVHISELSVIEAKAKILKIKDRKINEIFRRSIRILRSDERFIFHGYTSEDDENFEKLNVDLNFIGKIIVAQAFSVGLLLTEDKQILKNKGLLKNLGN